MEDAYGLLNSSSDTPIRPQNSLHSGKVVYLARHRPPRRKSTLLELHCQGF